MAIDDYLGNWLIYDPGDGQIFKNVQKGARFSLARNEKDEIWFRPIKEMGPDFAKTKLEPDPGKVDGLKEAAGNNKSIRISFSQWGGKRTQVHMGDGNRPHGGPHGVDD